MQYFSRARPGNQVTGSSKLYRCRLVANVRPYIPSQPTALAPTLRNLRGRPGAYQIPHNVSSAQERYRGNPSLFRREHQSVRNNQALPVSSSNAMSGRGSYTSRSYSEEVVLPMGVTEQQGTLQYHDAYGNPTGTTISADISAQIYKNFFFGREHYTCYRTPPYMCGNFHEAAQVARPILPTEHNFDRIQFKTATANNGQRNARNTRQQCYQMVVELWGDLGPGNPNRRWAKLAIQRSCEVVVRGRSPMYYQEKRRENSGSGGGSGPSLHGNYDGSDYSTFLLVYGSHPAAFPVLPNPLNILPR
ncbi:uncharacterized protein LMH87_007636 [Akanthomyces muscarius]|uniref:NDT80 domain-containing protein n=1 Tax=Akanthomyces muscarius TaxID=2231603 RepID=A0A9W8UR98_AKAMU|nr:uncharacterized protein LMH87_007636 [Akanthomyces muscarius]KAJ4161606.1 hypothetical protein LMH87_007636 [Akanthomyces muscarius]